VTAVVKLLGMGSVYEARHPDGSRVAIELLQAHKAGEKQRARLERRVGAD